VTAMRDQKVFQCGDAMKGQEPRFFAGAAAAPFADRWISALPAGKEGEAGASFIQTQLVYDVPAFDRFMEKCAPGGTPPDLHPCGVGR